MRIRAIVARQEGAGYRLSASVWIRAGIRGVHCTALLDPGRNTLVGRTALEGRTVHIPDVRADPEYTWSEAIERSGGVRTILGVSMMREGTAIGVLALTERDASVH